LYTSPLLAIISGFGAGSNVGSNAMLMPMQNFTGAAATMHAPQLVSAYASLAGAWPGAASVAPG